MSRRPKGGMGGARKKVGKQEPLVSEAWGTLATTTISMLEVVGSINEDANEECIEEAAQLQEMNKKRMGVEDRLQLLDAVNQMVEGFLGAFADMDAEAREENNVAELYENFYGSMFTIITESLEGINKDGVAEQAKEQLQQQLCMVLRLIDTLMAVSFENDEESALVYFKPFAGTLFELCCSQLCLGSQYDFFVRSMALGLLTDQIEGKHLNTYLLDPANKNIVELIIDTCFKLCAKEEKEPGEKAEEEEEEEDEEKLDPNEETSQNLGTQLLDTLTSSLLNESGESIAAPIIFARSSAVLSKADAPKLDVKAALICLAVLPEAATPFAKTPAYLNTALGFLSTFVQPPHDAVVRSGAYIALSEHFEHLKPEVNQFIPAILASVIQALTDPLEKTALSVKQKACLPLNIMIRSSEELPEEYLLPTSDKNLFRFLLAQVKPFATKPESELTDDDFSFLNEFIVNIRDFADSYSTAVENKKLPAKVGDYFQAFQDEAYELMLALSHHLIGASSWISRGQAVAAAAIIGSTMTQDVLLSKMGILSAALKNCMESQPADLEEGEPIPEEVFNLRQGIHATWSALANKLQDKIEPFVEVQIPFICRALAEGYGATEEEEPDEEDEEGGAPPQENEARDQEQGFALECYKDFLVALGPKFAPFQDRCFACITENYRAFGSDVQRLVVGVLDELPTALYPSPEGVKPTAGVDLVLPEPKLGELLKQCKNILLDYSKNATDSDVVSDALDALAGYLDEYGQIVINDDAKTLTDFEKLTKSIFKHDAPCQTIDPREIAYVDSENGFGAGGFGGFGGFAPGEDGEEDEGEEAEEEEEEEEAEDDACCADKTCTDKSCGDDEQSEDAILMDSALNTLGAVAKAKGTAFKPTLDALWPRILKLRTKKAYASGTSGLFADLAEALGDEAFADYRKQIMPLLLTDLNDAKATPGVLRNVSYAVGQIILRSSVESCKEYYEQAVAGFLAGLKSIQAVIDAKSSDPKSSDLLPDLYGARDNVIAALGRLLMVGAAELNERASLIATFLGGLPLKNDFTENPQVYAAIAKLVNTLPASHPGVIEAHYPALIQLFATAVVKQGESTKMTEKLKGFILKTARTIVAAQPALREQLSEDVKAEFIRRLEEAPAAAEEKSQ